MVKRVREEEYNVVLALYCFSCNNEQSVFTCVALSVEPEGMDCVGLGSWVL